MTVCLGLDVGGANLKLASSDGAVAESVSFPMWIDYRRLGEAISKLLSRSPRGPLAVTMTAELADCFPTKADGVRYVVDAVSEAAAERPTTFYRIDARRVDTETARNAPQWVAASNWHALATWAARHAAPGDSLLIDIGSTTTDVVPFHGGEVAAIGRNDPERLALRELVYTGVVRSPVAALVRALPWRGEDCPVAQELFAQARDAYLVLGEIAEDDAETGTADGRPATRSCACDRLARMICADRTLFDSDDAHRAALVIRDAQAAQIRRAVERVADRLASRPSRIIVSGQGEFLAKRVIDSLDWTSDVVSLNELLGPSLSRVAPAYALAVLASEAQR